MARGGRAIFAESAKLKYSIAETGKLKYSIAQTRHSLQLRLRVKDDGMATTRGINNSHHIMSPVDTEATMNYITPTLWYLVNSSM